MKVGGNGPPAPLSFAYVTFNFINNYYSDPAAPVPAMYDTVCNSNSPTQAGGSRAGARPGADYDDVILSNYDVIGEDKNLNNGKNPERGKQLISSLPPSSTQEPLEYSTVATTSVNMGLGGGANQVVYNLLSHDVPSDTPENYSTVAWYGRHNS